MDGSAKVDHLTSSLITDDLRCGLLGVHRSVSFTTISSSVDIGPTGEPPVYGGGCS